MLSDPGQPSGYWTALAHIAVASYSQEGGKIVLSAECRTSSEVAYWADLMIKELEDIKRPAVKMKWHHEP
jgi:hypothetical protein